MMDSNFDPEEPWVDRGQSREPLREHGDFHDSTARSGVPES